MAAGPEIRRMGHRANLVYKQGGYQLFYSHWAAITLPRDLFWGPERARDFILRQREVDGWLDDRWAEGGALLDEDERVLLLWGGEDEGYEVPLRRRLLACMQVLWEGWSIRWAHRGIVDQAAHLGLPASTVLSPARPLFPATVWDEDDSSLVSLNGHYRRDANYVSDLLAAGPQFFESWPGGCPQIEFSEPPMGGLDVLQDERRVYFWQGQPIARLADYEEVWPGWELIWEEDRLEAQLARAGGIVRLPPDDTSERLRSMLLREPGSSPSDLVGRILLQACQDGQEVSINPLALDDRRQELSLEERRALLEKALREAGL